MNFFIKCIIKSNDYVSIISARKEKKEQRENTNNLMALLRPTKKL